MKGGEKATVWLQSKFDVKQSRFRVESVPNLVVVLSVRMCLSIMRGSQITYAGEHILFRISKIRAISIRFRSEDNAFCADSLLDRLQIMYGFRRFFQSIFTTVVSTDS